MVTQGVQGLKYKNTQKNNWKKNNNEESRQEFKETRRNIEREVAKIQMVAYNELQRVNHNVKKIF